MSMYWGFYNRVCLSYAPKYNKVSPYDEINKKIYISIIPYNVLNCTVMYCDNKQHIFG